jgi:hypothetical protein
MKLYVGLDVSKKRGCWPRQCSTTPVWREWRKRQGAGNLEGGLQYGAPAHRARQPVAATYANRSAPVQKTGAALLH